MADKETRVLRWLLPDERTRRCWDAFMAPLDLLDLLKEDRRRYALDAVSAAEKISRESPDKALRSFRYRSGVLLRKYGGELTKKDAQQAREEMAACFLTEGKP